MSEPFDFEEFPKIPRLKREVVITEKIDGTNAQLTWIKLDGELLLERAKADPDVLTIIPGQKDGDSAMAVKAGSRNRWIYPNGMRSEGKTDNFGFAAWAWEHATELFSLGEGRHFGEWYGCGIQRGYDLPDKRFALFNVARWNTENPNRPACCGVVPILARGENIDDDLIMRELDANGSSAVYGYKQPEGIIVYHSASRQMYKRTFAQDGGKWKL
jgi:hypothetical protein